MKIPVKLIPTPVLMFPEIIKFIQVLFNDAIIVPYQSLYFSMVWYFLKNSLFESR